MGGREEDSNLPVGFGVCLQAAEDLGLQDVYERERSILETWENNGKILTLFSSLAAFLGATQEHFHGLWEQSEREKKDNQLSISYY